MGGGYWLLGATGQGVEGGGDAWRGVGLDGEVGKRWMPAGQM